MTATAYLAGPDVFLPNAVAHAAAKVEICRRLGLRGLPPLNEEAGTTATELEVWQAIYQKDVAMMEKSDLIIGVGRIVLEQACRQLAAWRASLGEQAPAEVAVAELAVEEAVAADAIEPKAEKPAAKPAAPKRARTPKPKKDPEDGA